MPRFNLRGKLILFKVFSYSCMNCQRSLKYIRKINTKYNQYGLSTVLIHPPEWGFEKNISNINRALKEQGICFPVIIDKNKKIIRKLKINFWPAYILMKGNKVLYKHIGEGNYKKLEDKIINILKIKSKRIFGKEPSYSKFPAVYLGKRKKGKLINSKSKLKFGLVYTEGDWIQNNEYVEHKGKEGSLTTLTKGKMIYIVAKSIKKKPIKITIKIDNKFFRRVIIHKPNLYSIARLNNAKQHKLDLLTKSGLGAYSFAFGLKA